MIVSTARRLYGAGVIAAHLRGQREIPFLPRERLDELRDRRIRRIITYAARRVPYYRELFAREGIDSARIRSAADLDRLPLLDRELVRAHPSRFVAETRAGRTGIAFLTSGTTGTPLEVRHDRRSLLANIAFGEREREPVNRSCGGSFRPRELYVGYETSTFKTVEAFYRESALLPVRPRRRFVPLQEPIDRVVAIANAEQPDVLVGYGGWIDLFFRTVQARRLEVHRPRLVMYMGEALPHGARSLIEDDFGIPVLSRYNAVEAFKIGFYCERRTGFHVHEDLCHVRIARPDGSTAASGESGAVVISNLVNRATVLLNYPIGDVASIDAAPCACGRSFRLLSELEGRIEDVLHLADGRFVHPRAVWQVFKDDRAILQYRLNQTEARRFEVELATLDESAFRHAVDRSLPLLRALLGPDASIETIRKSALDRPQGGKLRVVTSPPGVRRPS